MEAEPSGVSPIQANTSPKGRPRELSITLLTYSTGSDGQSDCER